jgi:CelD/BcsL family acetyltransferase involved in cellulose biosynthesis
MTASASARHREQANRASGAQPGALSIETYRGWAQVERAVQADALWTAWESVLAKDSVATFFQTPLWCVTWYRCYQDEFEPLLLAATAGGGAVALAPMARERATGRIVFAGGDMADYRDFVCADGWRREAVARFLPRLLACSPDSTLVVGQTQPDSDTVELMRRWASAQKGYGVIVRTHPCRRFRLPAAEDLDRFYRKKTVRQALSHYKRAGTLKLRRVRDLREWNRLKEAFFRQHSLRQACAGRPPAFDDPRKRAFYSSLFEGLAPEIHFSGLWLADRPLAFMFCFAYRGVLYYGAPSFDPLEHKHSPGILHILEAIGQCQREGFKEVDLTIGSSSFKERLANRVVELPTAYLYGRRWRFWLESVKKAAVDRTKTLVSACLGSDGAWDEFKERLTAAKRCWNRARRTPLHRLARLALHRLRTFVWDDYVGLIFRLTPALLCQAYLALKPGESVEFRQNRLEDFLTLDGDDRRHLTWLIQAAVERIGQGHTLHTVLLGGRLVHYGWAYRPTGPISLPETGTQLSPLPGAVSLYDFYTVEAYRGRRLYPANLSHIVSEAFKGGASAAYIVCESRNDASRLGIERVGFRRCAVHRRMRVLWWDRRQVAEEGEPPAP